MVRNLVLLSGTSHPRFADAVAAALGVAPSHRVLAKFSCGETRCEIQDSVRGKDVYIVQSFGVGPGGPPGLGQAVGRTGGGDLEKKGTEEGAQNDDGTKGEYGKEDEGGGDGDGNGDLLPEQETGHTVNDYFVELCIMIAACKTGSAKRVTAVLPLFPYSRQPDLAFSKVGAPLVGPAAPQNGGRDGSGGSGGKGRADYTFESIPGTPGSHILRTAGLESGGADVVDMAGKFSLGNGEGQTSTKTATSKGGSGRASPTLAAQNHRQQEQKLGSWTSHDYENPSFVMALQERSGHKQYVAQSGALVADLLTCAGADRILTCDLHESAYQGFFDIPVDNLYARPLLQRYIQQHVPNYRDAVIVSPDAGGAKRATAIADSLGLAFALIHKERRPPKISSTPRATMMLVGDVAARTCILIDDLADTAHTITRAAKLCRRAGARSVLALLTHGVLSGDAAARIEASALDRVVVTNTVAQEVHKGECAKLEVLDVSGMFAEAVRRVHHGESVSMLFQGEV